MFLNILEFIYSLNLPGAHISISEPTLNPPIFLNYLGTPMFLSYLGTPMFLNILELPYKKKLPKLPKLRTYLESTYNKV